MLEIIQETKLGLTIPSTTTLSQWLAIGDAFNRASDKLAWMIGDWINYGINKKWGDKYAEAITATGIEHSTLRDYSRVSQSVTFVVRTTKLSWTHHRTVADLAVDDQRRWLSLAVEHNLTSRELAASIDAGKIVRTAALNADRAAKAGLCSPQGVRMAFLAALRQATTKRDVSSWPPPMRAAWKAELKPIIELYAQL